MKYCIITYGCQMNESDSERIAAALKKQGHKSTKDVSRANLLVINACSVRQSAIHRVYDLIHKFHKTKKIILTGCLLEADKKKMVGKVAEIWHPDRYFACSPLRENKTIAYVPIMTGCNNFCSYCVVPFTRGREKSRPAQDIIKEVKSLVKNGHREIMLLGQNVNSYSTKHITYSNFPRLLRALCVIADDFKISLMTSHPKDMSDELIKTIKDCPKISRKIHLPVQSGDNKILRVMNRKYTVAHYKNLIKKIRRAIPEAKISTDVIVGFPGETKKQFQNTVKLFREICFSKAYVAKYSPRAGTAAAKLKDNIQPAEKKRRWRILDALANKK